MVNLSKYGIEIKGSRSSGEVVTTCPKCSHTRKKSLLKCLSVNLDKKAWYCNHCGWKGVAKEEAQKVEYKRPAKWENQTTLSEKMVKWFEGRGIRQKTLLEARIGEGLEFMPQKGQKCNTAQFNYFKSGELINVKYRTGDKCFKLFKDAELIFYNIDSISDVDECYIVEGEMDALSLMEAGIKNVISVPNGANLNSNNLTYVDNCIEFLMPIKRIHLAVDNDVAGRRLRDELADRFGKHRCDFIEWNNFKDANEVLVAEGIEGIHKALKNVREFPLEGVFSISDIDTEINDMYVNGLDKGIDLGIPNFKLNIVKGYITTITGVPSHGKSDWLDYMCLRSRIVANWSGAFYSPENKPTQLHFSKMARKLIGKHWDYQGRINEIELRQVKEYLDKKMWFLKPEKDFTLQSILNMVRDTQQRHGLDYFVIDAWNKLESKENDTYTIGKNLDEIAMFCELNNIHCFLVAHPTKMPKNDDGTYQVPTLYNIAGSSNFYNKTDNGICVYRDFNSMTTRIYRQKVKFNHWGEVGFSEYGYHLDSTRYYSGQFNPMSWIEQPKQAMIENLDFLNSNNDCPF